MKVLFKVGNIEEIIEFAEKSKQGIQQAYTNWCCQSKVVKELLNGSTENYWKVIKEEYHYYKIVSDNIVSYQKVPVEQSFFYELAKSYTNLTKITKEEWLKHQ